MSKRNWTIIHMNGNPMISTTLVDGTKFVTPVGDMTLSEWLVRVEYMNRLAVEALMEADTVLDRHDEHINVDYD